MYSRGLTRHRCIEVRRLIPSGNANRDFQSHLAYSCGCGGETELTYARLEGPYVAVESSTGLIVINWKDRCRAHIMIVSHAIREYRLAYTR